MWCICNGKEATVYSTATEYSDYCIEKISGDMHFVISVPFVWNDAYKL